MKKRLELSDLTSYKISSKLSNLVWKEVLDWNYFAKDTIGKQFVRSTDSIAANIAEGFGRYHFQDSIKFYYYSRGSIYETQHWFDKAIERELVSGNAQHSISVIIAMLPKEINLLIRLTQKQKLVTQLHDR